MNCQKAEQLIPLFVEADLDAAEMQQVTNHLETCTACSEIVAVFQGSQASLHALAAPDFDEAVLAAMRNAVQREIARPTNADWPAARWSWKLGWAIAAACLLLGGVVLYWQVSPTPENKPVVAQENHQVPMPAVQAKRSATIGTVPRAVARQRPTRKPQPSSLATARGTVPLAAPLIAEPVTASPAPALALTASPEIATPAPEPEMLRMEFHTADPNIKIIWLTPKEPTRAIPAPFTEATK